MRHMRDGKRFEQAWDEYVISNHLTASEQALFERLPGPRSPEVSERTKFGSLNGCRQMNNLPGNSCMIG